LPSKCGSCCELFAFSFALLKGSSMGAILRSMPVFLILELDRFEDGKPYKLVFTENLKRQKCLYLFTNKKAAREEKDSLSTFAEGWLIAEVPDYPTLQHHLQANENLSHVWIDLKSEVLKSDLLEECEWAAHLAGDVDEVERQQPIDDEFEPPKTQPDGF
jgi:hypothetical protein